MENQTDSFEERKDLQFFNTYDLILNSLYHTYASACGISDTRLWLYFILEKEPNGITQKRICAESGMPAQTINSCIKKMEQEGSLVQIPVPGSRREKKILLSKEGKKEALRITGPIHKCEEQCFDAFSQEEKEIILKLLKKYLDLFEPMITKLASERRGSGNNN